MLVITSLLALGAFAPSQSRTVTFHVVDSSRAKAPVNSAFGSLIGPVGTPSSIKDLRTDANGNVTFSVSGGKYYLYVAENSLGYFATSFDGSKVQNSTIELLKPDKSTYLNIFVRKDTSEVIPYVNINSGFPTVVTEPGPLFLKFTFEPGNPKNTYIYTLRLPGYKPQNFVAQSGLGRPSASYNYLPIFLEPEASIQPATPKQPAASNLKYKLDGMIRMTDRNRIVVGKVCTVSVNLLYSGGVASTATSVLSVVIKDPSGKVVVNYAAGQPLSLNSYAEKKFDVTPAMAGKYTVYVHGTGEHNSKWDGTFTFTANAK